MTLRPAGSDLQGSHCTLEEAFEDLDWEAEKGLEAVACSAEGFVPPKVMVSQAEHAPGYWGWRGSGWTALCLALGSLGSGWLEPLTWVCLLQLISSKVPKAEYIPTIIRRDDPSIIPILYVSALPTVRRPPPLPL